MTREMGKPIAQAEAGALAPIAQTIVKMSRFLGDAEFILRAALDVKARELAPGDIVAHETGVGLAPP